MHILLYKTAQYLRKDCAFMGGNVLTFVYCQAPGPLRSISHIPESKNNIFYQFLDQERHYNQMSHHIPSPFPSKLVNTLTFQNYFLIADGLRRTALYSQVWKWPSGNHVTTSPTLPMTDLCWSCVTRQTGRWAQRMSGGSRRLSPLSPLAPASCTGVIRGLVSFRTPRAMICLLISYIRYILSLV